MLFVQLRFVILNDALLFPLLCGSNQLTSSPSQTIINPRDVRDQTLRATACQFRECR